MAAHILSEMKLDPISGPKVAKTRRWGRVKDEGPVCRRGKGPPWGGPFGMFGTARVQAAQILVQVLT